MQDLVGTPGHLIFYFSGTGNTWWVAREISRGLQGEGIPGTAVSIEAVDPGKKNPWKRRK